MFIILSAQNNEPVGQLDCSRTKGRPGQKTSAVLQPAVLSKKIVASQNSLRSNRLRALSGISYSARFFRQWGGVEGSERSILRLTFGGNIKVY